MSIEDENYLFSSIDKIRKEAHENNSMLKQICYIINMYLSNHHQENEDDFGRNVLANIVSNVFVKKRK